METPEANLARALGQLNSAYAQDFNRRYRRSGHFLQGRYKANLDFDMNNPLMIGALLRHGEGRFIKSQRRVVGVLGLVICACLAGRCRAEAITINFDNLSAGVQAGDALASAGVTFTTGSIPDSIAVGDVITLASPDPRFEVLDQPANAVSPPNFALAKDGGLNDVLMTFTRPVRFVSLRTDHFSPEAADTVRLLALASTGNPDEFRVLAIAEGLDNATSAPADTLEVTLGGGSFGAALFQTTTEPEGFDDLRFAPVLPVPALSLWGMSVCLLVLWGWGTRALRRSIS